MMRKSLPTIKKPNRSSGRFSNRKNRESINDEISCPLCCNESFPTREALKHHLLNVNKNANCPICFLHCENIMRLIRHLDIGCDQIDPYGDEIFAENGYVSNQGNTFTLMQNSLALVSFKEDKGLDQALLDDLQIVEENKEEKNKLFLNEIEASDTNINVSDDILNRESTIKEKQIEISQQKKSVKFDIENVSKEEIAVKLNNTETKAATVTKDKNVSEPDEYKCSACNMCFNNIKDHITRFHSGEEVRIQGADEKQKKKLKECGVVIDVDGSNCTPKRTQKNGANKLQSVKKEPIEGKKYHIPNSMGYWSKRDIYYNFVSNEDKMRLLFPSFVPTKTKVETSFSFFNKKQKLLFNNLDLIQIVDDKSLHGSIDPSLISIYIVDEDKTKDSTQLGPIAKLIPYLPSSKIRVENGDKFDKDDSELNKKSSSNYHKHSRQYIQVLKVPLGKDMEITIENVDFDDLPPIPHNIIPYLEEVTNPEIPLLKGAKQLRWQCSLCLSHVSSVFMIRRHNCYKCKFCGRGFKKNISVFMKHLLVCGKTKANAETPFVCSCCPSYFKTIEEARKHMPLHFPGSEAVQCSICYCLFNDKIILNEHLINEHNTKLSEIDEPVKQPRLKSKSKFVVDSPPTCSSSPVSNNSKPTCSSNPIRNNKKYKRKLSCKSDSEPTSKTDDFSDAEINENNVEEALISPRSSRKRKINKHYFEEYFVY